MVVPVNNLHELADRFRQEAARLRASVIRRRYTFPWQRDHKLIEANVWEEAARAVDNTIIMGGKDESYDRH